MKPILFQIGPLIVFSYGFFYLLGTLLGIWVARSLMKRAGSHSIRVDWIIGISLAMGFIGMRVMHLWIYRSGEIHRVYQDFLLKGGMYYGGLIWATLTLFGLTFVFLPRPWVVIDSVFAGIASGHAFGRLGCFFAGCCWGSPTELPWGVTFTSPIAHETAGTPLYIKLHPVQLYEAGLEGILAFVLIKLARKGALGTGQILGGYLLGYGVIRFVTEFLRGVPKRPIFGPLDVNHGISLLLIAVGLILFLFRRHQIGTETGFTTVEK